MLVAFKFGVELYNTKEATLSVWRPVITTGEDGVDDSDYIRTAYHVNMHSLPRFMTEFDIPTVKQEFAHSDGLRADEKQGFRFQLREFAVIKAVLSDPNACFETIFISYKALGEMALFARQVAVDRQAHIQEQPVFKPGTRKRRGEPTPGVELMFNFHQGRPSFDEKHNRNPARYFDIHYSRNLQRSSFSSQYES